MNEFVLVEIYLLKYFCDCEVACVNIDILGPRDFSIFILNLINSTILNSHCVNLLKQNILSEHECAILFNKIIQTIYI